MGNLTGKSADFRLRFTSPRQASSHHVPAQLQRRRIHPPDANKVLDCLTDQPSRSIFLRCKINGCSILWDNCGIKNRLFEKKSHDKQLFTGYINYMIERFYQKTKKGSDDEKFIVDYCAFVTAADEFCDFPPPPDRAHFTPSHLHSISVHADRTVGECYL